MKKQQFNEDERWENYRLANCRFPNVRKSELEEQLAKTSPQSGETIVEVGTGNGYLTFELVRSVGPEGKVITYDYQKSNVDFVKQNQRDFSIEARYQGLDYDLEIPDKSVDRISTIATLHHYDDRSLNTGTAGKQKAVNEFYRVLKEGGKLVIGDVAYGTNPQRYFDAIDNPLYCHPRGHPHDFLTPEIARELLEKAGFKDIEFVVETVPWEFESEKQTKEFLHTIHNAKCSPEESLDLAKKYLPYRKKDGRHLLDWELAYITARK